MREIVLQGIWGVITRKFYGHLKTSSVMGLNLIPLFSDPVFEANVSFLNRILCLNYCGDFFKRAL